MEIESLAIIDLKGPDSRTLVAPGRVTNENANMDIKSQIILHK